MRKPNPIAPYTDKNLDKILSNPANNTAKWLPDETPEGTNPTDIFNDEASRIAMMNQVIALTHITAKKSRERIAAAFEDTAKRETLTPGELVLSEQIATVFYFSPESRNDFIKLLGLDPKRAGELIRQTLLVMGADEQMFLDGFEPPEEQRISETAAKIVQQKRLLPVPTLLHPSSLLARRITDIKNTGDEAFPVKNKSQSTNLLVKTNRRITPLGLLVDKGVSNLVNEYQKVITKSKQDALFPYVATTAQLFCMANGLDLGTKVSPDMLKQWDAEIEALRETKIQIYDQNNPDDLPLDYNEIDAVKIPKIRLASGHVVPGWGFSRAGSLHIFDERHKKLTSLKKEVVNITRGYWYKGTLGQNAIISTVKPPNPDEYTQAKPSLTELSMVIREYLIMEIFRIRNAASTPGDNPSGNKITYDRMIEYEADPVLIEFDTEDNEPVTVLMGETPRRVLRQGETPTERKTIRKKKSHRREIALEILGHFEACGWIASFQETPEKDGVIIVTDKTDYANRGINRKEKRKQQAKKAGEKNV